MAEPILLACVGPALSGLNAVFKLVEFGYQVRDVPIDSLVFVDLLSNVQADLDHATSCLREIENDLAAQPEFHRAWIVDTILRTVRALEEIGSFILAMPVDQEPSPSLRRRIKYVLDDYKKLSDREKRLRACHGSLLSAINAMNMLIYPRFRTTIPTSIPTSAELPFPRVSPQQDLSIAPAVEANPATVKSSTFQPRPRLSFESSRSLPILTELPDLGSSDWSPQSPTFTLPNQSTSSFLDTEYKYPELENAFRETHKSMDLRKSTDSLQRPSRQKPSENNISFNYAPRNGSDSTVSSASTEIMNTIQRARNDSQSTLSSTSWQTPRSPLADDNFSFTRSIHSQPSSLSLSETLYSETGSLPPTHSPPPPNTTASRRPSRQKPRPRPHSSFSDSVLASADLKLDSLSRLSSPRSSVETRRSLEADEKIGKSILLEHLITREWFTDEDVSYDGCL